MKIKLSLQDVEGLSTILSQLPKDDGVLVEGIYPNGVKEKARKKVFD